MPGPTLSQIRKSMQAQQARIDVLIQSLERQVQDASALLVGDIVQGFADKLGAQNGAILNTLQNQRLTSIIDTIYKTFNQKQAVRVVGSIVDGIGEINALNSEHFKQLYTKPLAPTAKAVEAVVNQRFGINADGGLERDGYMMGMLNDESVRNDIKQFAFKAIQAGAGYNDFKAKLEDYIKGNPQKAGIFSRFYRNYAYDVYSQVDRLNGQQYADRLKLNYAIYEGGIIETTREFCKNHNGKVYSRAEIAKMNITEAKPPNYDPFVDMGGYGCRHTWNWIPDALAFALRPDLKAQPQPAPVLGPEPAPAAAPVEAPAAPPPPVKKDALPDLPELKAGATFKPQPSVKALAAYAKDDLQVAGRVDFREHEKPTAEYMATMNGAVKTLQGLYEKYHLIPLRSLVTADKGPGTASGSFNYGIDGGIITINDHYLTAPMPAPINYKARLADYETLLAAKKIDPDLFSTATREGRYNRKILLAKEKSAKFTRWTISNGKQDKNITVIHEMGHKLQDDYFGIDGPYGRKTYSNRVTEAQREELSRALKDAYKAAQKSGDIYKISEYANSSAAEFFAESFALYETAPHELPEKVTTFLEKVLSYAKR